MALLRRLRRSPILWWLAVLLLATFVGTTVTRSIDQARMSAERYGNTSHVLVALRDLPAGTPLDAKDFRREVWPRAFLSAEPTSDSFGRLLSLPLTKGEPLVVSKVAPSGLSTIAAMLADGERAVTLPLGDSPPTLQSGDHVDVFVTFDELSAVSEQTRSVVAAARVLEVRERSLTMAVEKDEAPSVAFAATQGALFLAITGPPSRVFVR